MSELAARAELIQRLGIPIGPHPLFDEFATEMAAKTGFLYGFVNLFLDEQTFIGLHNPPADNGHIIVGRTMRRDHGWCPEVVERRKALPLHNVCASPRFSGNHVVDAAFKISFARRSSACSAFSRLISAASSEVVTGLADVHARPDLGHGFLRFVGMSCSPERPRRCGPTQRYTECSQLLISGRVVVRHRAAR
ncbi:hypothetical protein [Streptomyces sp. NPDC050704]|uniref:hypothetical protein n=1 Tax=Streptomyces sp. NPDC050704 TaxID=3157219 RepID=UPI003439F8EB